MVELFTSLKSNVPFDTHVPISYVPLQSSLCGQMSSPSSSRSAFREIRRPIPVVVVSKQTRSVSTKTLPPPPTRKAPLPPTIIAHKKQSFSPSLVQFSYQQKRPRFNLTLFSILRLALVATTMAGIPLCVIHARSTETALLHSTVLKLVFVCDL